MKLKNFLVVLPVVALLTLASCNETSNSSSSGLSTSSTTPSSDPSSPSSPSSPSLPSDSSSSSGSEVVTPDLPTNGEEVLELLEKSSKTVNLVNFIRLEQPLYYVDLSYYFYDNDAYNVSGMSFFSEFGFYFGPLVGKDNTYLEASYIEDFGLEAYTYPVGTKEEQEENSDIITQEDIDAQLVSFLVSGNYDFEGAIAIVETFMDESEFVNPGKVQSSYDADSQEITVVITGGYYDYYEDEDLNEIDAYYESSAEFVFEDNLFLSSVTTSYVVYDINDVSESFEIADGAVPLDEVDVLVRVTATQGEKYSAADGLIDFNPFDYLIPQGASVQVGKTIDGVFTETSNFTTDDTIEFQVTGSTDTTSEVFSVESSDETVVVLDAWSEELTIVGAGTTTLTFTSIYNTIEVEITVEAIQTGGDTQSKSDLLVGSWVWDEDYVLTFNADKTGTVEDTWYEDSASFTYEVDEETGVITFISETWADDFKNIVGQSFNSASISADGVLTVSTGAFGIPSTWTKAA